MSIATNPQKIVSEFETSAGLAIIFTILVVGGCIWRSELVATSILSAVVGVLLAIAAVYLVRAHRYREALWVFRSKFPIVVIGGIILYLFQQERYGVGAFAFSVYAGFWISVFVLKNFVAEQLTFIAIGADLEKPDIQNILKQ